MENKNYPKYLIKKDITTIKTTIISTDDVIITKGTIVYLLSIETIEYFNGLSKHIKVYFDTEDPNISKVTNLWDMTKVSYRLPELESLEDTFIKIDETNINTVNSLYSKGNSKAKKPIST